MSYTLDLQQKASQSLKQLQRLIMSRQMQQAIHLLQMPVTELSSAIELELEQNPVLEYPEDEVQLEQDTNLQQLEEESVEEAEDEVKPESELKFDEHDFEILRRLDEDYRDSFSETGGANGRRTVDQEKLQSFLESSVRAESTLFEHLMEQAREAFEDDQDRRLAEALIGNFDESGYLKTPLEEIAALQRCKKSKLEKILMVIQTFYPVGVGARDLRESLLIQLKSQGKQKTLAYAIIEKHFDDLLHNRISTIKKTLRCSSEEVSEMIDKHIVKLDLHPGTWFSKQVVSNIIPDVAIRQEDDKLVVIVNEDSLPPLRLNSKYLRMLEDETLAKDAKEFIQQKIVSAKWLLRNIFQRNETLEKIAHELTKRQAEFLLNPEGKLAPLTMKVIAGELHLHESTIARAVSNKYIDTPRGLLPLRSFFTNAIETEAGEDLSSRTVKDLLRDIIKQEDKSRPLSDEAISAMIKAKGISCARRTVAKYRSLLKIGTAQQRRKF